MSNDGYYLAFDPGAGRTDSIGYVLFNPNGTMREIGQLTYDQLLQKMTDWEKLPIAAVVCEDYVIRRNKASSHVGSRVETVRVIGAIKLWAERTLKTKFVLQMSNILTNAQLQFNITIPSDHTVSHQISALLHGLTYLHSIGKAKTFLEREYDARTREQGLQT